MLLVPASITSPSQKLSLSISWPSKITPSTSSLIQNYPIQFPHLNPHSLTSFWCLLSKILKIRWVLWVASLKSLLSQRFRDSSCAVCACQVPTNSYRDNYQMIDGIKYFKNNQIKSASEIKFLDNWFRITHNQEIFLNHSDTPYSIPEKTTSEM